MNDFDPSPSRSGETRATRRSWWLQPLRPLLLCGVLLSLAPGCGTLFSQQTDNRPRTVTEFMKQPRLGSGVLGP